MSLQVSVLRGTSRATEPGAFLTREAVDGYNSQFVSLGPLYVSVFTLQCAKEEMTCTP